MKSLSVLSVLGAFVIAGASFVVPTRAEAAPATPDGVAQSKTLYSVNCSSCHGATGRGDGLATSSLNPRPKPFSASLRGKKEADVIEVITKGKGQMPGWGQVLKPDEIKLIYTYIKDLSKP